MSGSTADLKLKLPKWKSHKIVQAAPIATVTDNLLTLRVSDVEGQQFENVPVLIGLFLRYRPVEGDYYVVYDDGYVSISPKKAFEDGYSPL